MLDSKQNKLLASIILPKILLCRYFLILLMVLKLFAPMVLDYNTPLTDKIVADSFCPLANSVSMYYLFTGGHVNQRSNPCSRGGQLAPDSKGCSFSKALFLLA